MTALAERTSQDVLSVEENQIVRGAVMRHLGVDELSGDPEFGLRKDFNPARKQIGGAMLVAARVETADGVHETRFVTHENDGLFTDSERTLMGARANRRWDTARIWTRQSNLKPGFYFLHDGLMKDSLES